MARPSARLEEKVRADTLSNIEGILSDLVKSTASKKDLLIAARVVRLAINMGFDLQHQDHLVEIIKGANKHEINFVQELEAL